MVVEGSASGPQNDAPATKAGMVLLVKSNCALTIALGTEIVHQELLVTVTASQAGMETIALVVTTA